MSQANADRNLLFGILALQLDFITRDQLVAAMQAWVFDKGQTLGQILRKQGALAVDTLTLIEALVQKHLAQHGNDIEKSLAAVSSVGSVREELKQVADPDVQASLVRVPAVRPEAADPFVTTAPSVGQATSSGLRFRILRPHAKGGLGEVLVARDEELHREVALKQIQDRHADDCESQARFLLEAEITGGLEHPGIVPVYGLGQYGDGRPFYAMRFIRGASLKDAIEWFHAADKPGRDSGERSLELRGLLGRFVDVCNAIAYAHSRGVLHRDLKPGNVMLGKYGETLVVDWGLAKPLEGPASKTVEPEGALTPSSASLSSHTLMGSAMGTPQYMSPEQAAGRLDILGPASDVYSLGATLYNLLTGKAPVQDSDVGAILQKVQKGDFPPPRQIQPNVPEPLQAVCLKAMALAPGDRYTSAQALGQDIEHWLADEPVSAWHEPWTVRTRRWLGRHRTLVTGAATAVLVATVGLAVATVLLRSAYESERQAKELAEDREAQVRKEKEETEKQRAMAEHNFQLAKDAVDSYHTKVSENRLLHEPGMQPLRQELLEEASKFYKQFVQERGKEPALRGELGKALYRLAQITGEIDSEVKALALHLEAQQIFKALAAADATALDPQSDLASCSYQLGRLYYKADRLDQAAAALTEALALWQPLVVAHPENESYRADQARSRRQLGGVYEKTRRLDQAEGLYKTALDSWADLALASPKVAEYRRDLAATQTNLAMVATAHARKKTAEDAFGQAVTIQEQLVRDFPHISRYQNDLARSHFNLGDLRVQFGDTSKAGPSYVEAARLWKDLVDKHPAVTDFNIRLAESYTALAVVYSADGQSAQAEKVCQEAIKIKQKLALAQKQVTSYQDDLARGHFQLGNVYRAGGKASEAQAAYQDALRILEKLSADLPGVPQYQVSLAKTWNNLGLMRAEQRENEKAEEVFRKALATWTTLTRDQPGNVEYALGLSATAYNLGNLQPNMGNAVAALDWYAQAIRAAEALGPQNRAENTAVKVALRNAHWKRGQALALAGRHADALQDWNVALELSGQVDRVWFELYHAAALARAGDHVQATAEAAAVAPKTGSNGEMLYQLICVYALSTGAAAKDIKRTPDERQALAEQYAARAFELLRMAQDTGYFKKQPNLQRFRNDTDLDPLRPRAEFHNLLDELEKKSNVSGE